MVADDTKHLNLASESRCTCSRDGCLESAKVHLTS